MKVKPVHIDALLRAASHALRSYQHGNSSPELAAEVADAIDAALANISKSTQKSATAGSPRRRAIK
jgi:hypothetical protein